MCVAVRFRSAHMNSAKQANRLNRAISKITKRAKSQMHAADMKYLCQFPVADFSEKAEDRQPACQDDEAPVVNIICGSGLRRY